MVFEILRWFNGKENNMRKHYIFVVIIAFFITSSSFNNVTAQSIQTSPYSNSDSISTEYYKNVVVSVNVEKELFPVIAKFLSEGNESSEEKIQTTPAIYYDEVSKRVIIPSSGNTRLNLPSLVSWNIQNKNNTPVHISITSEIPDWTQPVISTIVLEANENKELNQTPFGIRLLANSSTIPSVILLKVKMDDKIIFEETQNIKIRPADDMIWSLHSPWDTESLIAAWVTPKNDVVEQILSNAKEKLWSRSLSGYQNSDVVSQAKAIFNAVRNAQVSYVNSSMSFGTVGFTQRVRLPQESILQKSANCIDGAVLFASLFENIGLEPLIVLIPGHAFVGVRLAPDSRETLFIETTLIGRRVLESILTLQSTFDAAVKEGNAKYNNAITTNPSSVHIIDIKKERENGIYPLW